MKRILSVVCVFLLMFSLIAGCSASKKDSGKSESLPSQAAAKGDYGGTGELDNSGAPSEKEGGSAENQSVSDSATAVTGTGSSNLEVSNPILSERKIIRNANVSVEVEDFDKAYGKIKSFISAFGFIQESSIKKDKIYVDSKEKLITSGTIIIRVEKDKFESVLTDVKGLGTLMDENIRSDDVTDKFFDTESMLRLLKYEQSRLEEYLLKITDPDVIFKTQSRLTEIRHEIEKLTGTLKKWTDLVELSTITINLYEKRPTAEPNPAGQSYWGRLSGSFVDSMKGVINFCGNLLIFIVQALPVILLLALVSFAAWKIYRRFFGKLKVEGGKETDA